MRSTPRGENGIAGRRYYIKGNGNHAFTAGSEQAIRHLAFRDYLRKHHDVAQQYAAIKRQAAEDSRQNPAAYGRLKNEFVQRHEQLALRWPGWPQEKPHKNQAWTAESTYHHLGAHNVYYVKLKY